MAKEYEKSNSQNLPASTAEFIKQVLRMMRYRRKVQQEVQAELVAHFEDELKDCATYEEREQKAQQLIAEFGDVKLLAVLLRRAKKRCRPLWWTIVARTFQTAGVLILCFILYVVWFLSGKPVITTDYIAELNSIVRPGADESLNAAPLYHKAAELYEKLPDDISKLLGTKYKQATAEQKLLLQKWLTDNEQALELVVAGSKKPYYWRKYSNKKEEFGMIGVLVPKLSEFRKLAYSLLWRAQVRAEQGRYEAAFDDMKSCYRLGQHLKGDKTTIEQLVGIAIEVISVQAIRDIISKYQINAATLAALQQDFEQMIADEDFTVSLKVERLFIYDEIQRCFTDDKIGKGHLYLPRFLMVSDWPADYENGKDFEYFISGLSYSAKFLFGHPNKEETLESANEFFDYCEQLSLKTAAQMHVESDAIDNKLEKFFSDNIFLETLAPAVRRVVEISNRLPTEVGATFTVIATLRYKQDKGRYPQDLNQLLTAGYLKQLPMDSFADKPLVYKKTDDNLILYSVGHNFTDNGGESGRDEKGRIKNWRPDGDTVFWPMPKSVEKQ